MNFASPPALLVLVGMSLVKHQAIARLERGGAGRSQRRMLGGQLHFDAPLGAAHHQSHPHAATLGKTSVDQLLMVNPLQKAGAEAARKTLRQVLPPRGV